MTFGGPPFAGFFFRSGNAIAQCVFRSSIEPDGREGAMQPSWTFPIPQTMQQHRGSQVQRTVTGKLPEMAAPTDGATPPASASLRDTAREDQPQKP